MMLCILTFGMLSCKVENGTPDDLLKTVSKLQAGQDSLKTVLLAVAETTRKNETALGEKADKTETEALISETVINVNARIRQLDDRQNAIIGRIDNAEMSINGLSQNVGHVTQKLGQLEQVDSILDNRIGLIDSVIGQLETLASAQATKIDCMVTKIETLQFINDEFSSLLVNLSVISLQLDSLKSQPAASSYYAVWDSVLDCECRYISTPVYEISWTHDFCNTGGDFVALLRFHIGIDIFNTHDDMYHWRNPESRMLGRKYAETALSEYEEGYKRWRFLCGELPVGKYVVFSVSAEDIAGHTSAWTRSIDKAMNDNPFYVLREE